MPMPINKEFLKKHWLVIAGGFVGVYVLYYILKHSGGGASAVGDLSSGGQGVSAGQLMAQAQLNGTVEVAQINGQVASQQVAAQLASNQLKTSAELAATLAGQQVDLKKVQDTNRTVIGLQHVISTEHVDETKIQGNTLLGLAKTAGQTQVQLQQVRNQVAMAQITNVDRQLSTISKYSKHASQDYAAIAPVIYAELGQGSAGASVAGSNAAVKIAGGTPAVISAASGGIASILTGLFA